MKATTMKAITLIVSAQTDSNISAYLEKLRLLLGEGSRAAILCASSFDKRDETNVDRVSFFHCSANEAEKVAAINTILAEKGSPENDVLLINGDLLLSLPNDISIFQEMREVLYYTEKHAFVSPRIGAVEDPAFFLEQLKRFPRFSITAEPDTRCVLIKRRILDLFEKLDTRYAGVPYALLDFAMHAYELGFSSTLSNHSFVCCNAEAETHLDSLSPDHALFTKRYPYDDLKKQYYENTEKHPLERFMPLFSERNRKKRIVFNYQSIPCWYGGAVEFHLFVFDSFYRLFQNKYDIYLYTTHEADRFHRLSGKYPNILFSDTITGVFDLGFCGLQPYHLEDQFFFNKFCLKSIYTMYDIIGWRVNFSQAPLHHANDIFRLAFQLCDGILSISNYSIEDYKAYFFADVEIQKKPSGRVYIASHIGTTPQKEHHVPFTDYVLIAGNSGKYKAIPEAIEAVANMPQQFIVIGGVHDGYIKDNVYGYLSGHLSEDFIIFLYANCKALIYPSTYEGFGLPVALGLKNNKRVIVYNSKINQELFRHFHEFKDSFFFFDRFSQISEILHTIDFSLTLPSVEYKDTWDASAVEIESFFEEILNMDVDTDKLYRRWHLFHLLEAKMTESQIPIPRFRHQLMAAVKGRIRNRFPRLYLFAKKCMRG